MTIFIPMWIVWTLGIIGGLLALLVLAVLIAFVLMGYAFERAWSGRR